MAIVISQHGSENILSLDNPDILGGSLRKYTRSHEELTLQFNNLEESQPIFELILVMVKYIELPFGWQGARIDTATEEECERCIVQVFNINEKQKNANEIKWNLLDRMRLYIFKAPKWNYRVLAYQTTQTEPI